MKLKALFLVFIIALVSSCDTDDTEYEMITVATAQVMSKADFRESVEVLPPQNIEESGKIYAFSNYIFINDKFQGVHIIDNTDPENPSALAYLKIPGNIDISIKNNFLYADSSIDLVVFDISNINDIQEVERLEDVFSVYDFQLPNDIQEVIWNDFNYENQVITGWTVTQERREVTDEEPIDIWFETGGGDLASNDLGTGGSLARFQIVDDYLYTVGSNEMSIFNISNLDQPSLDNTMYAGWNIETMFHADGFLYLGSTNGMYIYSIDTPANPTFISEFVHWEGCDPVVVDGDYAYLTLRGGNLCGQEESVLEIIDVSNKYSPELVATYTMENPYGLGIKDNLLFICDGTAGLKVYDKTDPIEIEHLSTFEEIFAKDVIPLNDVLLMIGDEVLYQYEYAENNIIHLSTLQL